MKRIFTIIISLVLLLSLLVACGGNQEGDKPSDPSEKNVEITFMIPDWGAPTEDMLKEFEEESNIRVKVLPTSWDDIRDKISTATVGKTVAADVFEVDWSWVGEFVSADWLMPIELEDNDIKDMPTVNSFTIDDKIYALPYANDFRIAYHNNDMFSQIDVEENLDTWDDIIKYGKELKSEGIVEYPVSLPLGADENSTTTFLWLAYTRNGIIFNNDGSLNEDSVVDALTIIDTLNKEGLINPANRTSSGMDAYRQITSGDTGFIVGPSSFVGRVNDPEESQVIGDISPSKLPGKDGFSKSTVPFAEAVGISPHTEHPEEAEKFVKWYTSVDTQRKMFENLNTIPTRNSVLQELIDNGDIENSGAMMELANMIESMFPNGVPKYYSKMTTEIFNIVNQLATEQITVEEAADSMIQRVDDIVEDNK